MKRLAADAGLYVMLVEASRSGRTAGYRGALQRANDAVAQTGHSLIGETFPLSMAHVFILRKRAR